MDYRQLQALLFIGQRRKPAEQLLFTPDMDWAS